MAQRLRTGGMQFDGVSTYIEVGDVLGFEGRAPFSVAFWAYDRGYYGVWAGMVNKYKMIASDNRHGWYIGLSAIENTYTVERWRYNIQTAAVINYTPNQWNFIVGTYDGSTIKGYLNGDLVKSVNSNIEILPTGTPLRIGCRSDIVTDRYRGTISDLRIYNRALSGDEVMQLYQGKHIADGLVLHYDFSRGVGDMVYDKSKSGYHGRVYGNVTWAVKRVSGMQFDGTSTYIHVGDVLGFEGRAPFSVVFWSFDPEYIPGIYSRIVCKRSPDPRQGWTVLRLGTGNSYSIERWRDGTYSGVSLTFTPNQWNFIVFTYDGSTLRGYLNSRLVSSSKSELKLIPTGLPLRVGCASHFIGALYRGTIGELRIYNRALTQEEISQLYQGNHITDGLVLYYDFSEGGGSVVYDKSKSGYHGTVYGNPRWVAGKAFR